MTAGGLRCKINRRERCGGNPRQYIETDYAVPFRLLSGHVYEGIMFKRKYAAG